jgi:DnaJ-class molecular chaperone
MSGCHEPLYENVSPMVKKIQELEYRIKQLELQYYSLQTHKNYQIEENRKISRRVDELEIQIEKCIALGSRAYHSKKPHKCPVCLGSGAIQLETLDEVQKWNVTKMCTADGTWFFWCKSCKGEGFIWG